MERRGGARARDYRLPEEESLRLEAKAQRETEEVEKEKPHADAAALAASFDLLVAEANVVSEVARAEARTVRKIYDALDKGEWVKIFGRKIGFIEKIEATIQGVDPRNETENALLKSLYKNRETPAFVEGENYAYTAIYEALNEGKVIRIMGKKLVFAEEPATVHEAECHCERCRVA